MGCKTHYRRTIEIVVASIAFIAYNMAIDHWGFMNMRNSGMLYLPFCSLCLVLVRFWDYALKRFRVFHSERLC